MIDLAMHMMDIAQNSIRANAKTIAIVLNEDNKDHTLTFSVQDDGCGMNEEQVKKLADPFFTTRTTRRVGLGVPFLKMTAEQTGGSLKIISANGEGTAIEAVYRTDNPDCLPLGDLAGYLTLLLKANPGIRFRFVYRLNDETFELDSEELKQQEIDLRHAQMVAAVKEYMNENLTELFNKRSPHSFLC